MAGHERLGIAHHRPKSRSHTTPGRTFSELAKVRLGKSATLCTYMPTHASATVPAIQYGHERVHWSLALQSEWYMGLKWCHLTSLGVDLMNPLATALLCGAFSRSTTWKPMIFS
jgi:hypothetical protein